MNDSSRLLEESSVSWPKLLLHDLVTSGTEHEAFLNNAPVASLLSAHISVVL